MIDLLMATYNGEKYLNTQISSIVNQTFTDWTLYIHDDGSTDKTVEIIQTWTKRDNRIVFINDGIQFHQPGLHFLYLLGFSNSQLICFVDQDDYWFENKLEVMEKKFKTVSTPKLVMCRCYLWNSEKNTIIPKKDYSHAEKLNEFLFLNGGLQGCAMMFNRELGNIVKNLKFEYTYMHDHVLSLAAYIFGEIDFISDYLFLYRQHALNASVHIDENSKEHFKTIITNNKIPFLYKPAYDGVHSFYEIFKDKLPYESKKILEKYLQLTNKNKIERFFTLMFSNFKLGQKKHIKLIIKYIIRPFIGD